MPSHPGSDTSSGAGFVILPLWILTHSGLTDCDIRVLLLLDQIGWREGNMDGTISTSNEEIGKRIGKSASTVKVSLRRIEAIWPRIITRDMSTSHSRDSILLTYDRYGSARMDIPTGTPEAIESVGQTSTGVGEIPGHP